MKYRGNLMETGIAFAFGILFIGILLGAGAVGLNGMLTGVTVNSTEDFVMKNGSYGLLNMSLQMPTVGTIAGVGLIILVLFVSIGAYVMHKKNE